jgi:glycosyltransferase involved in cell wall biosynthesis
MGKEAKRILVLTYWAYQDALIQTYTLPYLKIMSENPSLSIWLVCLQPSNRKISESERDTINQSLAEYRIRLILLDYKPLSFAGLINTAIIVVKLFYATIRLKINTLHAWATPAGALGFVIAKPLMKTLVIDSYEPHAEAMVENGTWKPNGFPFRLLFWLEKKQTHYAKDVISATAGMRQYAQLKYNRSFAGNFYVKPACVDLTLFNAYEKDQQLKTSLDLNGKMVALYAGKFGGIYLDKEFFQWVRVAEEHWGNRFRLLLLTAHSQEEIAQYCEAAGVNPKTIVQKFVPHHEVPVYMGLADFAVTPVKPVPSKRYCSPIKDGEYWAMGLPVIITKNISDDSEIIKREGIGYVLDDLNEKEYLKSIRAIEALCNDANIRQKIVDVAVKYRSFEISRNVYRHVYPD